MSRPTWEEYQEVLGLAEAEFGRPLTLTERRLIYAHLGNHLITGWGAGEWAAVKRLKTILL